MEIRASLLETCGRPLWVGRPMGQILRGILARYVAATSHDSIMGGRRASRNGNSFSVKIVAALPESKPGAGTSRPCQKPPHTRARRIRRLATTIFAGSTFARARTRLSLETHCRSSSDRRCTEITLVVDRHRLYHALAGMFSMMDVRRRCTPQRFRFSLWGAVSASCSSHVSRRCLHCQGTRWNGAVERVRSR